MHVVYDSRLSFRFETSIQLMFSRSLFSRKPVFHGSAVERLAALHVSGPNLTPGTIKK